MSDLSDITSQLGDTYRRWKESGKVKDELRDRFFQKVNEELEQEIPPRIVVEFPGDEEFALRQAQRKYVRHRVISTEPCEGGFKVILEENHEYRPYTYINKEDGTVYQRITVEGTPTLDDEAIREENPELWGEITQEVTERQLKPLEDLTPEQLEKLQPYISLPKPQTRLASPRKAKPEELDDDVSE